MRVDVDAWNAAHPVGTEMAVRVQAKGPWYLTKTTSAAWRVGIGGDPLVTIEGREEAHYLTFLRDVVRGERLPPLPALSPSEATAS